MIRFPRCKNSPKTQRAIDYSYLNTRGPTSGSRDPDALLATQKNHETGTHEHGTKHSDRACQPILTKYDWIILSFGLIYAFYWLIVSPIQYNGDSESYLGVARMLLGLPPQGIAPIFRSPGYPILLALTGAVIPGTFILLLSVQALFAAIIPVIIYHIVLPYGHRLAIVTAIIAILSGTTTAHISQIMSEPLFTFLLFVGISLAITLIRKKNTKSSLFYWLALTFAALNTVRPFAWLMFWPLLSILTYTLWRDGRLINVWKNIAGSALLFILLMFLWAIVDDVIFSFGARYSPLLPLRMHSDHFSEIYRYDIPFNEAYFSPWKQRVDHITEDPASFGTLNNRPAMAQIHQLVLLHITKNKSLLSSETTEYPQHLFGKYVNQPERLADRIFSFPNYKYANYVHSVIEKSLSKSERFRLYDNAAHEAGYRLPMRWMNRWYSDPLLFFKGPSRGNGPQQFLLAYTSLQHFQPKSTSNINQSLINSQSGPATRFLFTTIAEALQTSPELWQGTQGLWDSHINKPKTLTHSIVYNPSQTHAWEITVMLWDLMGYDTMSQLLSQVANETLISYKVPFIMRVWTNIMMVAAGPAYMEFDHINPQIGEVEIYDYLETAQLTAQQKRELRAMQHNHLNTNTKCQAPIRWGYFLFYLGKPFFFLTSIISVAILWSRNRPVVIPLVLMLPYYVSIIIYGTLFMALPRYTDPTLLLPLIVTCIALPECINTWNARRK